MKVYYSEKYNNTSVDFETTRKADWLAASLQDRPIANVTVANPERDLVSSVIDRLPSVHDPAYVKALVTGKPFDLASSNGIGWDDRLFGAVSESTAGVVAAVNEAIETNGNSGSFSSGLHHARFGHGNGFCTVNGVAIAALHAAYQYGLNVAVIDWDAHCGGGTAQLLDRHDRDGRVSQYDLSVSAFDGRYDLGPDRIREIVSPTKNTGSTYLDEAERMLGTVQKARPDMVIYNAGMDPHEGAGGLYGITAEHLGTRERMLFGWAAANELPVAFALAGGYTVHIGEDELVDLHRLTLAAAA